MEKETAALPHPSSLRPHPSALIQKGEVGKCAFTSDA